MKWLLLCVWLSLSSLAVGAIDHNKTTPITEDINFSMVISGGVSLGAYEAGYNWAIIKMLSQIKAKKSLTNPNLKAVTGASAGSINALLSAIYWCQKESVNLHNSVDDNLFYDTWVNLGIEDLIIAGSHPTNKSSLFTRKTLEAKGEKIIHHMRKPIFKKGCNIPMGVAVTKVVPIVEEIQGIKVKNQNFSVPLRFMERNGKAIVANNPLPPSGDFYLSIPNIEKDRTKIITLLFASGAFPGAFEQVKLDYSYKGKKHSNYFIDGGLYDNVPLDLAIALDKNASTYFFMDPSNMRKEAMSEEIDIDEEIPLGFIKTNLLPIFSSFDIMQSMKLYEAINRHFYNNPDKRLVLSSRFHPLTGKFLSHFGAFLDHNFRIYDYYVGVYDAIFHLASAFKKRGASKFANQSIVEIMDQLKGRLGIDQNPEALRAYRLFRDTEFKGITPPITDRFSAIYNAFDLESSDSKRYSNENFSAFLYRLDPHYLDLPKEGFVHYAKRDIDNWHKRPLRFIVNRISSIEVDRAKVYPEHQGFANMTNLGAWGANSFISDKNGWKLFPLDVPNDEEGESLRSKLRFLPNEIATDLSNGGLSLGYNALYYEDMEFFDGFELRGSYLLADNSENFLRFDASAFTSYEDSIKIGGGISFFGDLESSFYKRKSAYGFNSYISFVDIFRFSYIYRFGENESTDRNYFYFGVENIPSLIYWLSR
jgi:predicted acylesterase/phospholipase RssA